LPLGDTAGKDEAWLRDVLQAHPSLIPVGDIDPAFGPLLPVCTELRTGVGSIDNVFINPDGRLTLVECKLWRNPEARRKLIAQVLDYAAAIAKWSYSDLQRQVNSRTGGDGNYLFKLAKVERPSLEEHHFVDSTAMALRQGRFLLLLAGDGIREDVEAIGELINRNAAAGFSFGMFEVALYRGPDETLMVHPRVIARTQLIKRTVVALAGGQLEPFLSEAAVAEDEMLEPQSAASIEAQAAAKKIHAVAAEWWTPVLSQPFDDPDQPPARYYWPHNVRASLPWPGTWILGYRTTANLKTVGVELRGSEEALGEAMRLLEPEIEEVLAGLPVGTRYEAGKSLTVSRKLSEFPDEDSARTWLAEAMNSFVNQIRPRLAREIGN